MKCWWSNMALLHWTACLQITSYKIPSCAPFANKMAQKEKECCNYKDFPQMTVVCKILTGALLSCLLYNLIDTTVLETQWNFDCGIELLTWSLLLENSRKYLGSKIEMLMLTPSCWQNSLLYLAFVVLVSSWGYRKVQIRRPTSSISSAMGRQSRLCLPFPSSTSNAAKQGQAIFTAVTLQWGYTRQLIVRESKRLPAKAENLI